MVNVLSVVLPIMLIIGLGLAAVRSGAAKDVHIEGLAAFVLNFALPAVMLTTLAGQDMRESFNLGYLVAYGGGSLAAFAATFAILRFAMGRPLTRAGLGALGGTTSNTGFIGYPVAALALGAPALAGMPMTMLIENALIIPLGMALAELGRGDGTHSAMRLVWQTLARLARMPLLLAIAAGLVLSLAGIQLPDMAVTTLEMLAAASAPCALFVVGGTVARLNRSDISPEIFAIVAGKLLIHPVAVTAALLLVPGIPTGLVAVGMLFSSVSMITIYPLFCARHGMEKDAATALVAATVLAFAGIAVMLGWAIPLVTGQV